MSNFSIAMINEHSGMPSPDDLHQLIVELCDHSFEYEKLTSWPDQFMRSDFWESAMQINKINYTDAQAKFLENIGYSKDIEDFSSTLYKVQNIRANTGLFQLAHAVAWMMIQSQIDALKIVFWLDQAERENYPSDEQSMMKVSGEMKARWNEFHQIPFTHWLLDTWFPSHVKYHARAAIQADTEEKAKTKRRASGTGERDDSMSDPSIGRFSW